MRPWQVLRFRDTEAAAVKVGPGKAEQAAKADRPLRCRACGWLITTETARCAVGGAHEHQRTNPAGFEFRFGCFRDAPGCGRIGPASGEHTWFAGCVWRIAVCGGCGEHLGWAFSGADTFYGLILDRLVRADR
ncbi:MAG: hypothetical protein HYR49_01185 [Gammaproteobacteria bacterium]|nr:hypothetical protein [Gammaproteobacteria bacterium]